MSTISVNRSHELYLPTHQSPARDQQVIDAWNTKRLDDGTRLNLGLTDREQAFVVRDTGIFPIAMQTGTQRCEDGSERVAGRMNLSAIGADSGGHTHPRGRENDVSALPGPEDGRLARATGDTAYVISQRGAFAIDHDGQQFNVRLLVGKPLSAIEQGEIARTIGGWNANNGGSGVQCTFTPTP
jgi:hypothetical protein